MGEKVNFRNSIYKPIFSNDLLITDVECIRKVQQIYEEMDFPPLFEKYRNESYESIRSQIQMANENIPRNILECTLDLTISNDFK